MPKLTELRIRGFMKISTDGEISLADEVWQRLKVLQLDSFNVELDPKPPHVRRRHISLMKAVGKNI